MEDFFLLISLKGHQRLGSFNLLTYFFLLQSNHIHSIPSCTVISVLISCIFFPNLLLFLENQFIRGKKVGGLYLAHNQFPCFLSTVSTLPCNVSIIQIYCNKRLIEHKKVYVHKRKSELLTLRNLLKHSSIWHENKTWNSSNSYLMRIY